MEMIAFASALIVVSLVVAKIKSESQKAVRVKVKKD